MNFIFNLLSVAAASDSATGTQEFGLPALCITVLAVLFVAYVYIMKAINSKKASPASAPTAAAVSKTTPAAQAVRTGVMLENTDEKDAAVIMAIVANKSGIPIERLDFKSIKLMEDK